LILKFIDEETLLIQKVSQNGFERKECIFSSNFSHKVANIFPTENRSHSLDEDALPPSINICVPVWFEKVPQRILETTSENASSRSIEMNLASSFSRTWNG